jgi:hypothetical protein
VTSNVVAFDDAKHIEIDKAVVERSDQVLAKPHQVRIGAERINDDEASSSIS